MRLLLSLKIGEGNWAHSVVDGRTEHAVYALGQMTQRQ